MEGFCSEGKLEQAVCCCACKFPLLLFCERHAKEHRIKESGLHFTLPLSAVLAIPSKQVYFQAREWLNRLNYNFEALRERFEEFSRDAEKIAAAYKEVEQYALEAKTKFENEFSAVKADFYAAIESAISDTSTHAFETQSYVPIDPFSQLLWYHDSGYIATYQIYTFQTRSQREDLDSVLQVAIQFTVPGFEHLKVGQLIQSSRDCKKASTKETALKEETHRHEMDELSTALDVVKNSDAESVHLNEQLKRQLQDVQSELATKDQQYLALQREKEDLQKRIDELSVAVSLQTLLQGQEEGKHMNICLYCHKKEGVFYLDCGHPFCRECILCYVNMKLRESLTSVLKLNRETVENFVCPKITCSCQISGQKLSEIVGMENFERFLAQLEKALSKRYCWQCRQTRHIDMFQSLCIHCKSNLCLPCCCGLSRSHEKVCGCGNQLSPEVIGYLQQMTRKCDGCLMVKSICNDFVQVECDGHILCRKCLTTCIQEKRRCLFCYRDFAPQEIGEILKLLEKRCCFCEKECSRSQLITQCECIICMSCAREKASQTLVYSHCFNCSSTLSTSEINKLTDYISTDYPKAAEPVCPICYEQVSVHEKAQLGCADEFHKRCLQDYFTNNIEEGHCDETIPCPICGNQISYQEIRSFVSQDEYSKYYGIIIRMKTTPCPWCNSLVEVQDETRAKKGHVICQNCTFHFCVECKGQYFQGHDEKLCKFTLLQAVIRDLEVKLELTDILAQCPNCKAPVVNSSGCDNVKCKREDCKTYFCVQCSVPTYLYKLHGNSWHRPSCTHYQRSRQDAVIMPNCKSCVSQGKLCTPPRNLKVQRRFDYDEYEPNT